jgi:hypothetical protein
MKRFNTHDLGRVQNRLILLFKGINQYAKLPMNELRVPQRQTRTMHEHHYIRPRTKTDTLQYSFLPKTIKDWNSLPGKTISKALESQDPVKSFTEFVRGGGGPVLSKFLNSRPE